VAVLGSGIDVWYPQRHRRLGEAILEGGGAVVSEFPPGTPPAPWRFPCRNRIIAGWASVVVVVEAAERSGALITARLAAEWGRDVLALPGDIHRPTSQGANALIRDGAHPLTSIEEAIEMVERVTGPLDPPRPIVPGPDDPLLAVIGDVPVPVEEVVAAAGLPVEEVLRTLTRLEMEGRVRRIDGGVARALRPEERGGSRMPP
jgi:DNA processing protein